MSFSSIDLTFSFIFLPSRLLLILLYDHLYFSPLRVNWLLNNSSSNLFLPSSSSSFIQNSGIVSEIADGINPANIEFLPNCVAVGKILK